MQLSTLANEKERCFVSVGGKGKSVGYELQASVVEVLYITVLAASPPWCMCIYNDS